MDYSSPMTKTFRTALLDALQLGNVSLKAVADGAGVSYEQLKKVRQRDTASTNVDDALKVARFFGLSLDEFLDNNTAQVRAEIVQLYARLSKEERLILQAAARGLRAAPPDPDPVPSASEE